MLDHPPSTRLSFTYIPREGTCALMASQGYDCKKLPGAEVEAGGIWNCEILSSPIKSELRPVPHGGADRGCIMPVARLVQPLARARVVLGLEEELGGGKNTQTATRPLARRLRRPDRRAQQSR